ncbi:type II toxin-antitoxin system prevent-host-death family antitoxin [Aquibium sp. ELW1220]|uniref:type II toxin-antitoxin system prevent-host-death family antitoxin n=1 Tax=Aquibium sp. ELW1220 TaxID=2976766 RepID=UPI0025B1AF5F|nr:type II toxin-antitoxin system prevent-host-death family antitoxin [Aquibium sp. ELW1220]MDN2582574.1 type II toxin-antitoxin system prevent-host-death family antitoxin [Aquibium sp. ELW1220]
MNWHLQDAKDKLPELIEKAIHEGPQTVSVNGKSAAVVLSIEEFEMLAARTPSLGEFLLSGPTWDDAFVEDVNRRSTLPRRDIDL